VVVGAIDAGRGYVYFNPQTVHKFSAVLGFTYNAMQYQNGVDLRFDWSASQFLKVQVGYSRSIGAFRLAALYQFGPACSPARATARTAPLKGNSAAPSVLNAEGLLSKRNIKQRLDKCGGIVWHAPWGGQRDFPAGERQSRLGQEITCYGCHVALAVDDGSP
jgi:hypothetical protein